MSRTQPHPSSLGKITKQGREKRRALPRRAAPSSPCTRLRRLRWRDSVTARSITSGTASVCQLGHNSLLCTYRSPQPSQCAALILCGGNKNTEKQPYYGLRSPTAAANKMDAALCRGFICSTESFAGNMAETEIIVDAILRYFHGLELAYVAKRVTEPPPSHFCRSFPVLQNPCIFISRAFM